MALMTGIDLDRAFAIPVLHVAEYPDLSAMPLGEELGAFHPLQGHVRLGQHPRLQAVCRRPLRRRRSAR
jgi:hypothetical protein